MPGEDLYVVEEKLQQATLKDGDEGQSGSKGTSPENPNKQNLISEDYVIPEEHRSTVKHNEFAEDLQIPVIDLTALTSGDKATADKIIAEVGQACEIWGFFQVVGHEVPIELLERVEEEAKAFFALPLEEKRKIRRTFRNGYGYYESELTKNVRDWKEVFDTTRKARRDLPDNHALNHTVDGWVQYPEKPEGFRPAVEAWYEAVENLAYRLLEAISRSLGLPATHFHKHFANHSSALRLNNYPPCPDPSKALGVSRHKDSGALTVLVQDQVGGLQVRTKQGQWVGVKPRRDAFVINVGDMFQVWSNDKYKSIEHRVVVNESKARLSVPFFFNPSYDTEYAPVPELVDEEHPARYRSINWGEFSRKRNDGNFADFGEEIQIHHYAIPQ